MTVVSEPSSKKRALLIAIQHTQHKAGSKSGNLTNLNLAHQDAKALRDVLIASHGYQMDDITLMMDDKSHPAHLWPSRSRILHQIDRLTSDVPEDCNFFFYFSGHGLEDPDRARMRADGQDDEIVCADGKPILDYILHDHLIKPLQDVKGSKLFGLFDCCHSETLLTQVPMVSDTQSISFTVQVQPSTAEPSTTANSSLPASPQPTTPSIQATPSQPPAETQPLARSSSRPFIAPPHLPRPSEPMSLVDVIKPLQDVKGSKLFDLFDSCHSETLLGLQRGNGPNSYSRVWKLGPGQRFKTLPTAFVNPKSSKNRSIGPLSPRRSGKTWEVGELTVICLSFCRDGQEAREGRKQELTFTKCFLDTMAAKPNITWTELKELVSEVRAKYEGTYLQDPSSENDVSHELWTQEPRYSTSSHIDLTRKVSL